MGGLSNFLSWVSEEREREITIGKSKGTQKGETYSQSGSSEAPQFLVWCGFFFFFFGSSYASWSLLPRAHRASAVRAAGLWARGQMDGVGNREAKAAVEAGRVWAGPPPCPCTRLQRLDAWRWGMPLRRPSRPRAAGASRRALRPSSRRAVVKFSFILAFWGDLTDWLGLLLRSRWILTAAMEEQGGRTSWKGTKKGSLFHFFTLHGLRNLGDLFLASNSELNELMMVVVMGCFCFYLKYRQLRRFAGLSWAQHLHGELLPQLSGPTQTKAYFLSCVL